jgi:hypothetical protein
VLSCCAQDTRILREIALREVVITQRAIGDAEANGISDREHLGIQTAYHPSGFERLDPGSSEIEDAPSASLAAA